MTRAASDQSETILVRGKLAVDAPSAQRSWGIATALMSLLAFPAAITLQQSMTQRYGTPIIGAALSAFFYFGGLALAASSGRAFERRSARKKGALSRVGDQLQIVSEAGTWHFPLRSVIGVCHIPTQNALLLATSTHSRILVEVESALEARRIVGELGLQDVTTRLQLSPRTRGPRAIEGCLSGVAGLFVSLLFALGAVLLSLLLKLPREVSPWVVPGVAIFAAIPILFTIRFVGRFGTPVSATIGSEGAIVRHEGSEIYVPYADVERVESWEDAVILRRRSCGDQSVHTAEPSFLASALNERLDEAGPASLPAPTLARCGVSVEEWKRRLQEVARAHARYRIGHLDESHLAEVAEDPRAAVDERVGAAFVLGLRGETAWVGRVRVAAERLAHPSLRETILAATEGVLEEDAMDEAERAALSRRPVSLRTAESKPV